MRNDPTIVTLASKYEVSAAQIILGWHMGRGTVACAKSANAERQKENIKVGYYQFRFVVGSETDMV